MSFLFVFIFLSFPVLAAAPSDADSLSQGLGTGWSDSSYGYPTGWQSSWFWVILSHLRKYDYLHSGWSVNSNGGINSPSGSGSSWFSQMFYELRQVENLSTGLFSQWGYNSTSIYNPSSMGSSWFYSVLDLIRGQKYTLDSVKTNVDSIKTDVHSSYSYIIASKNLLQSISDSVSQIEDVIADSVDVALKQASSSTVSAVTSEYFSGDGGSEQSIKASNSELGDFKGIGKFFRRFDSGVSISSLVDLFDPYNDQYGLFTWLSQENAESLNPLYSQRRSMSKSSSFEPIVTDYYHENLDLISSWERDHS